MIHTRPYLRRVMSLDRRISEHRHGVVMPVLQAYRQYAFLSRTGRHWSTPAKLLTGYTQQNSTGQLCK
jgi:hypothetical protein